MKFALVTTLLLVSQLASAAVFSPIQATQIPKGEMPKVNPLPVESPNLFAGKRVAILASHGVEESEITYPYQYLVARGAQVEVLVPSWTAQGITASRFLMPTLFVQASGTFTQGLSRRYDLIVLTGGAWNAQVVKTDNEALKLVQQQHRFNLPIAAICAGTSVLINAGFTKGLTMTGSPPVRLDLINSGANFRDQPTVFDQNILTSRTPDDLAAFAIGLRYLLLGR